MHDDIANRSIASCSSRLQHLTWLLQLAMDFFFLTLRNKLQEKFHRVRPAYSVQSFARQKKLRDKLRSGHVTRCNLPEICLGTPLRTCNLRRVTPALLQKETYSHSNDVMLCTNSTNFFTKEGILRTSSHQAFFTVELTRPRACQGLSTDFEMRRTYVWAKIRSWSQATSTVRLCFLRWR